MKTCVSSKTLAFKSPRTTIKQTNYYQESTRNSIRQALNTKRARFC